MNASLTVKKIGHASTDEDVSREHADESLSIIVSAVGSSPLKAVKNCNTSTEVREKLQIRYAVKSIMNKLSVWVV